MESPLFKVNYEEIKSSVMTTLSAAFVAMVGVMVLITQTADFSIATANWQVIVTLALSAGFSAFVGSLGKKLLTTQDGKFAGFLKIR